MLTYQIRPRVFKFAQDGDLKFPAQCTIRFHFLPDQPFGITAEGGRIAVRGAASTMLFNANTGAHSMTSKEPLKPLDVTIEETARRVILAGKVLSIIQSFDSLNELEQFTTSIFFGLPPLLGVSYIDTPYVERVDGAVDAREFRWELSKWNSKYQVTSQETQENDFVRAWRQMGILTEPHRRRLVAGLHYFHSACRLAQAGATAGEFLAEVLLNLAKTLEVLFPPIGDVGTRDSARAGLKGLDYSDAEIEGEFWPAMALRNEVDVGHVQLALFTSEQLRIIHAYAERAESSFRGLFLRLLTKIEEGSLDVAAHEIASPSKDSINVVERLKQHTTDWA